jgi:hypothetical protein
MVVYQLSKEEGALVAIHTQEEMFVAEQKLSQDDRNFHHFIQRARTTSV